jgi:hypothetical protein
VLTIGVALVLNSNSTTMAEDDYSHNVDTHIPIVSGVLRLCLMLIVFRRHMTTQPTLPIAAMTFPIRQASTPLFENIDTRTDEDTMRITLDHTGRWCIWLGSDLADSARGPNDETQNDHLDISYGSRFE